MQKYRQELEDEEGFSSVKDVCDKLLGTAEQFFDLQSKEEVIDYLTDYKSVSEKHLEFHRKWEKLPNMSDIAAYDEQEIEKLNELIDRLTKEQ